MNNIVGQKIKEVRMMTQKEASAEGWDYKTTVIVLENGQLIYSSKDDEGNGPGALFGISPSKEHCWIFGGK